MNQDLRKRCSNCREVLDLEQFALDRSKGPGRKSICKRCDREKARAYYEANREKVIARVSARYEELHKDVPDLPASTFSASLSVADVSRAAG